MALLRDHEGAVALESIRGLAKEIETLCAKRKALIKLLRGLGDLLADEATRNPDFAARLDDMLAGLPKVRRCAR